MTGVTIIIKEFLIEGEFMFSINAYLFEWSKKVVVMFVSMVFLSGLVSAEEYYGSDFNQQNVRFNQVKGWMYSSCSFPSGEIGECVGVDIDGQVGYPLNVQGLTANCTPDGRWEITDPIIISGSLPPGMKLNSRTSAITGIPEKRGHWIVEIRIDPVYCGGLDFFGIKQQLRFHITGSGSVNY